jgi:2-polyprenyl-6-methoxyphenol hydroxylase-like FAD-dependent oxidoreductase
LIDLDSSCEILMVERQPNWNHRGATLGLARSGQKALSEMVPPHIMEELKQSGIYMASSEGYMLPWWTVRDTLLKTIQTLEPYKDQIRIHLQLSTVVDTVEGMDDDVPIKVSFRKADKRREDDTTDADDNAADEVSDCQFLPPTQYFDLIIGADGVHSDVRTRILKLPPPVSTNTVVFRGSLNMNDATMPPILKESLRSNQVGNIVGKMVPYGNSLILAIFNFSTKLPGVFAWVLSMTNASQHNIAPGKSTAFDVLQAYRDTLTEEERLEQADALQELECILQHTLSPSELTWCTEMAVVDLEDDDGSGNDHHDAKQSNPTTKGGRWGGTHRITLVGDAAHSLRPASGLGGSMAFEDVALLRRHLHRTSAGGRRPRVPELPHTQLRPVSFPNPWRRSSDNDCHGFDPFREIKHCDPN